MADAIQQIRWRSPDGAALEHCAIREGDTGVTLEGVAIPADAATALRYRVVGDAGWTGLRSAHLTVVGGPTLALRHDGYGGWTDGEGKTRKELAGALDLYLDLTPVTVMLMLRRLGGKPGKAVKLDAVKADLATLSFSRLALEIACTAPGRYSVTPAGGAAETISLGDDGLIAVWDNRFVRLGTTSDVVAAAS